MPDQASASDQRRKLLFQHTILLTSFIILAALTPMAAKFAMQTIPPISGGLIRFGLAGTLLLLTERLMRSRGKQPLAITPADRMRFFWAALLCVPINQYCFMQGIQWANASHAGLFYALNPVLTFIITVAIGRAHWSGRMAAASLLAFIGAATLGLDTLTANYGAEFLKGDVLLFGAVLSWALFSIVGEPLAKRYGAVRSTSLIMFFGSVMYLPALFVDLNKFDFEVITWESWAGFAYITLGTSYTNYMLWFVAIKQIEINRVSIGVSVAPVIAVIAAYLFLGEPITRYLLLGAALIMLAIVLANWDKLRKLTAA